MSKKIYIKIPPPKKILKDWPKINKFVQHYLLCMWHTWKSSIQHGGVSKQGGQHRVPFSNGLPGTSRCVEYKMNLLVLHFECDLTRSVL